MNLRRKNQKPNPPDHICKCAAKVAPSETQRWIEQMVRALEEFARASADENVDRETLVELSKTMYDDLKVGPIDPRKYEPE